MKKLLINSIKGQAVIIGKEILGLIKANTKIKAKTNAKQVLSNLINTVKNFKNSVNRDSRKFKESVKENCKVFKKDITEDSREFKKSVIEVVKETEAEIELNDRKLLIANKEGIKVNKNLAKEYLSIITTDILNIVIDRSLSLFINYSNSFKPELKVVA